METQDCTDGRRPIANPTPGDNNDQAPLCQPCKTDNSRQPAAGFCETCQENLCQSCLSYHRKLTATRNHLLLDKSHDRTHVATSHSDEVTPPQTKTTPIDSGDTPDMDEATHTEAEIGYFEVCRKHANKLIKYFCEAHGSIDCSVCTTIEHRACAVDYIPDIAHNILHSQEYKVLLSVIDQMRSLTEQYEKHIDKCADATVEAALNVAKELRNVRVELMAYFDHQEAVLLQQVEDLKEDHLTLLAKLRKDCQKIDVEVNDLKVQLRLHESESVKLFFITKRSHAQVERLQHECKVLHEQIQKKTYHFQPSVDLQTIITGRAPAGEIISGSNKAFRHRLEMSTAFKTNRDVSVMKLAKCNHICVKSPNDAKDPFITGLAMLTDNLLLVADKDNQTIKMVDTTTQTIVSSMVLGHKPWDVTRLPNHEAAVTLPKRRSIEIVSTNGTLSSVRKIQVGGTCRGICYEENLARFAVVYVDPGKLEILDKEGVVHRSITSDIDVGRQSLFIDPSYVTMHSTCRGVFIYVSDGGNDTVCKFDMSGKLVIKCTEDKLYPSGLASLGNRYVVASSCYGDKINMLREESDDVVGGATTKVGGAMIQVGGAMVNVVAALRKIKYWQCARDPQALEYCPYTDTLYVSSASSTEDDNYVRVYKLT